MDTLVAATLHITQETCNTYRVLYSRRYSGASGAAVTLGRIQSHDTLRRFLQQFEPLRNIAMILARVESRSTQVLDLGYVDDARVARVVRDYTSCPIPVGLPMSSEVES